MNWRELIAGTLWGAAVISVAQATWEAYTQTYQPFPLFGSGSGTGSGTDLTSGFPKQEGKTSTGKPGDFTLNPLGILGQILGTTFHVLGVGRYGAGAASVDSKEAQRLTTLTSPPKALIDNVIKANRQQGDIATPANALGQWALAHGWKSADVTAYLKLAGVKVFPVK